MMASVACVRAPRTLALASLCVLLAGLSSSQAGAQGALHHPLPRGPRALHQIAARSDAIAIGTIASVSEGRIQVHEAVDVSGSVPAEFEVKRAPSAPPVFQAGDRAVLLLRGARSPYLLVDDPQENLVVPAGSEVVWILALRSFADASHDPARLRGLYFDWIDGNNATLQDLAVRGLVDPTAPFQPIPLDLLMDRARRAVDPSVSAAVRKASASVALLSPESAVRLLHEVVQPSAAVDAAVYEMALQGALLREADAREFSTALGRGLRSENGAVRAIAVRYAADASDPALANEVERLAAQDPDPGVRRAAAQALATKPGR